MNACVWLGGWIPLGNGLLNVVARLGVSPPSSDVVMLVTERFTGEL